MQTISSNLDTVQLLWRQYQYVSPKFPLSLIQYEEFNLTQAPAVTMITFILFMFVMPILLLNMLIAKMASTFDEVTKNAKKDWTHQWAKFIIIIERSFRASKLLKVQEEYCVKSAKHAHAPKMNFGKCLQFRYDTASVTSSQTCFTLKLWSSQYSFEWCACIAADKGNFWIL